MVAKKASKKKPTRKPASKTKANDESVRPLRLEYIDAAQLDENPKNWRTHPQAQVDALQGVLEEVGWAGALLYNERTKRLVDGHARKRITKGDVPVLIGSWTEEQEQTILRTLDPIAAMAEVNKELLGELLKSSATDNDAIKAMLDGLAKLHSLGEYSLTAPDEFPEVGEGIETQHACPKCGYEWN